MLNKGKNILVHEKLIHVSAIYVNYIVISIGVRGPLIPLSGKAGAGNRLIKFLYLPEGKIYPVNV